MNHSTSPRTEHLFIIRVWFEPDGVTATAQWRGSVQHGTTHRRYFAQRTLTGLDMARVWERKFGVLLCGADRVRQVVQLAEAANGLLAELAATRVTDDPAK